MNHLIELSYVATLLIGVACFSIHNTVRSKNLTATSPILKWKSTTIFYLLIMVFNICDFLIIYFRGSFDEDIISWFFVAENLIEIGLAYTMICMERDYAGMENPRWLDIIFVVIGMIIFYGDSAYTLGPLFPNEKVYVTAMICLNMIPIILLSAFGLRYWKIGREQYTHKVTNVYMLIYNIVCILLCFISTISIIDSRTSSDYVWYDKEIHVTFWLAFNLINLIFIWRSCVVDEREDLERLQSADEKLEVAAEKYGLSQREKEIAELLFQGKNNKEMAAILYLSPNTIKVHASNLYRKLGAANRVQAAAVLRGEDISNYSEETEEE
ncbi:MAG: LuxR family transcriptional regulator [Firmicutes bacterium]|nr:LuxR family transcriptional regulator [Bacillota bacterium]